VQFYAPRVQLTNMAELKAAVGTGNGPKTAVYGIQGATAVVMLAISALLLIA
jgi:hypothetical protein